MTVKALALKPGELKLLTREGRLLLAARCALRVEPWRPPGADRLWDDGLALVVAAAWATPPAALDVAARARALTDRGALASHRLAATDEPLGRCHNHAMATLAAAIEACAAVEPAALAKGVIGAAKLAASIAAIWAHAGRVRVHGDPVDLACTAAWDAIRADLKPLAANVDSIAAEPDRVAALRTLQPLWPGGAPAWAAP